jgi:predicted transcriptional regulator
MISSVSAFYVYLYPKAFANRREDVEAAVGRVADHLEVSRPTVDEIDRRVEFVNVTPSQLRQAVADAVPENPQEAFFYFPDSHN